MNSNYEQNFQPKKRTKYEIQTESDSDPNTKPDLDSELKATQIRNRNNTTDYTKSKLTY